MPWKGWADCMGAETGIFHRHLIWPRPGTLVWGFLAVGARLLFTHWQHRVFFRVKCESLVSRMAAFPTVCPSFPVWRVQKLQRSDEMWLERGGAASCYAGAVHSTPQSISVCFQHLLLQSRLRCRNSSGIKGRLLHAPRGHMLIFPWPSEACFIDKPLESVLSGSGNH